MCRALIVMGIAMVVLPPFVWGDEPSAEKLLAQARRAAAGGELRQALKLAGQAIEADAKSAEAFLLRGRIHDALREHRAAAADYAQLIQLRPKSADAHDLRGSALFCAGEIKKSIADFDRAIQLDPRRERGHWKRGISYYYAGKYLEGQKQFEAYQTFDDNDVENAVWRYLCMARRLGVEKAKGDILKVKKDPRVPMTQVWDLYAGKLKPDDVLAAARAGKPDEAALNRRLFYTHLYLGLYYDSKGDAARAKGHVDKAVGHKIGHYMWDVAKVHAQLLAMK